MDDVQHAQLQGLVHLNVPGLCWQGPREQLHGALQVAATSKRCAGYSAGLGPVRQRHCMLSEQIKTGSKTEVSLA